MYCIVLLGIQGVQVALKVKSEVHENLILLWLYCQEQRGHPVYPPSLYLPNLVEAVLSFTGMFSKLVVLSHEVAGLVHADQKPEDCLIPLNDGQMKRSKTMLVSPHIQGMQGLPSEFNSRNSVEVSFILDFPLLRCASIMSFESWDHFFSLSGINLWRPFVILVRLGLFPLKEVAKVFEPI